MAEVLRTTFLTVIQNELFRGAEFLRFATNHDAFVNDKTVEIPQAGTTPDVTIDDGDVSLPLAISKRTDDKRSYNLKNFRTAPIVIERSEELETSYQKAASVIQSDVDKLNETIGDFGANEWSIDPTEFASNIVPTTGSASANCITGDMTGSRKSLSTKDLSRARSIMGGQNVPNNDRFYCLMPSNVYWDFLDANENVLDTDFMNRGNLPEGMVAKVHGWHIFNRATTSFYAAGAGTKNAFGAAVSATDEQGILCWNETTVARALGSVEVFANLGKAELQGDLYSALIRFQATLLRNDGKGVVTIVQDT